MPSAASAALKLTHTTTFKGTSGFCDHQDGFAAILLLKPTTPGIFTNSNFLNLYFEAPSNRGQTKQSSLRYSVVPRAQSFKDLKSLHRFNSSWQLSWSPSFQSIIYFCWRITFYFRDPDDTYFRKTKPILMMKIFSGFVRITGFGSIKSKSKPIEAMAT